ncbi:L,D-transpeptidase family protein [Neobacillus sp. LXY-1]|uniref:L,D-transpeptidase family protein n=1 Tax=Neobacillus sp. LXY-1 TaxID=3379133 RepID=UPI003EE3F04E
MSNAEKNSVEENRRAHSAKKKGKNWKYITIGGVTLIALLVGGMSYYQATRFNSQVTINNIKVGGLTADQALKKLKTTVLKNEVYVGDQQILDEADTQLGFSNQDLPEVKDLLKKQWTFIPTSKLKNYSLVPEKADQYRSQTMKKLVEEKLQTLNKSLKAPVDAQAKLEQGQMVISKSSDGEQYDVPNLLKDYDQQEFKSEIHLKPVFIKPVKEDSDIVKNEQNKLQEILKQTVEYKVQDKVYTLNASEVIKNASVSKEMKVNIDPTDIKNKITEVNTSQATLNKLINFTTHSGSVISVKARGYGWALDVDKEAALIQGAFEKGEKSVTASNIYGHGWGGEGIGYETTTNNGIGDTYAEVSIKEQRIWIYKNGKLAVTTNVVTGKHSTGEDTSPGLWYILYKRNPSILRGTHVGSGAYEVKVNYWAPFTNSGQGFHDAGWRKNWSGDAYLNAGSGGCVNTPSSIMKTVYDNLSTYEPVVVY